MTGRGAGSCAGYERTGYGEPMLGRYWGPGVCYRGRGRGWRNMYYATGLPGWARPAFVPPAQATEQQLAELKAEADWLAGRLAAIQKHVEEIEGKGVAVAEQ